MTVNIQLEWTPNPNTLKYVVDTSLLAGGMEAYRKLFPEPSPDGALRDVRGIPPEDLRTIHTPILALHGRDDQRVPLECSLTILRECPRADLHVFDAAGDVKMVRKYSLALADAVRPVRRLSLNGGAGGAIVNVSSGAARIGAPGVYIDYAASKGAVDTFTLGLGKELAGEGVRVNAVRPGVIDTEIHAASGDPDRARTMGPSLPMGRAGRPDEIANAIVWLLSDEASYLTASIVDVTGGR